MEERIEQAISQFLKNNQRVLICCGPESEPGSGIAASAARHGGVGVFWEDIRWGSLLREAFVARHSAIAGPPQLLLGLSKLSKQRGTPLFIRDAILTESCAGWVRESIERGLDCRTWVISEGDGCVGLPTDLQQLQNHLLHWSSVLDCRLVKGSYGLEIQAVVFPGKKLPKFPSCAKLDVQPWDSERHIPFYLAYDPKNPGIYMENH